MNEVNPRRVSTGMADRLRAGIPSRYVTSQLGQLSLASPPGSLNRVPALDYKNNVAFVSLCFQCFDAVGWAAGRASGL